jgi:hypothetical protein
VLLEIYIRYLLDSSRRQGSGHRLNVAWHLYHLLSLPTSDSAACSFGASFRNGEILGYSSREMVGVMKSTPTSCFLIGSCKRAEMYLGKKYVQSEAHFPSV